jgi:hypothetical protein
VHLGGGLVLVGDDDERVDLEVGELAVDIDGVEAANEVDQDIVNTLGNLLQEDGGELLIRGVFGKVNRDQDLLSLGVNIADIDTTLVGEQNPVAL